MGPPRGPRSCRGPEFLVRAWWSVRRDGDTYQPASAGRKPPDSARVCHRAISTLRFVEITFIGIRTPWSVVVRWYLCDSRWRWMDTANAQNQHSHALLQ